MGESVEFTLRPLSSEDEISMEKPGVTARIFAAFPYAGAFRFPEELLYRELEDYFAEQDEIKEVGKQMETKKQAAIRRKKEQKKNDLEGLETPSFGKSLERLVNF